MAQHILLTVVWMVMKVTESSPWAHPGDRWKQGQAGGAGTCPRQSRAPVVATLRGWIWKQQRFGTEEKQGGEGPGVPCAHLLKSKWMDAKPR